VLRLLSLDHAERLEHNMFRFHHKLAVAAFLVVAGVLGITKPAAAGIEIDYSIDSGSRTFGNSSSGSSVTFTSTDVGGKGLFSVDISVGTTNTPGGAFALVTQSNNTVATLYSSGSHTLHIYVSSTGFTSPQSPPPAILGNASSITENGGHTDVTFTSYGDTSNTLFGTTGSSVTSVSTSYSANDQTGVGSGSNSTLFSPNGNKYSLTNIGDYTLTGGTSLTVVSGNTKVTPTPVPAGMTLALSGLPVLGLGYWFRRRQLRLAPVA
jgi:hypothetical protein